MKGKIRVCNIYVKADEDRELFLKDLREWEVSEGLKIVAHFLEMCKKGIDAEVKISYTEKEFQEAIECLS